ncbi:unnamed protein product [Pylaiella littoralis]
MPRPCVAPTCHKTGPRRRPGRRTLPGRCARPNPWNAFRTRISGQGLPNDVIPVMYNVWKHDWSLRNPGLSRSAARAKMNETLCAEIDQDRRLAQARTPPSTLEDERRRRYHEASLTKGKFFAKKSVPHDWSLNAHIKWLQTKGQIPFEFRHQRRSDMKTVKEAFTLDHLRSLRAGAWFKDTAINAYMALLSGTGNPGSTTSIFMTSFFYSRFTVTENTRIGPPDPRFFNRAPGVRYQLVQRWTRSFDTTGPVKIFVPVNAGGCHWFMIMIDVKNKKIWSMDSMGVNHTNARKEMLAWIEAEHASKRKPFVRSQWTSAQKTVPRQLNNYDCGPFTCLFAAFLSNEKRMTFLQGDLPKMRNRIAWSILHGTLA